MSAPRSFPARRGIDPDGSYASNNSFELDRQNVPDPDDDERLPHREIFDPPIETPLHRPTFHDSYEPRERYGNANWENEESSIEDLEQEDAATSLDRAFAMELQAKFNSEEVQQKHHQVPLEQKEEEPFQHKTYTEKAFIFTSKIVQQHTTIQKEKASEKALLSYLTLVNADDVLFYTERLFQHLDEMPSDRLRVEVGYVRYSQPLNDCPNDTMTPMNAVQISVTDDGPFGSGIYVANHPFCFGNSVAAVSSKNDRVLMIARLNQWKNDGGQMRAEQRTEQQQPLQGVFLGSSPTGAFQISVLGRSAQCVPLVLLDKRLLNLEDDHFPGNELVLRYHVMIQNCLDEYFNVNIPKTPSIQVLPSQLFKSQRSSLPSIPPAPDADGLTPLENFYTDNQDMDFALAVAMDEKETVGSTTASNSEPRSFTAGLPANAATVTGTAFSFTSTVVESHDHFLEEYYVHESTQKLCRWFSLVNADDVLFFSERLLQYWNDAGDISSHIDIGYARYDMHEGDDDAPRGDALPPIRSRGIVTHNGPFGDGIYVANHPYVSSSKNNGVGNSGRKGDKILMVARVRSTNEDSSRSGMLLSGFKFSRTEHDAEVYEISVMGRSSQCIPLVLFDSRLVDSQDFVKQGHVMVYRYHCLLQGILDEYFNIGRPKTVVTKRVPSILRRTSSPTRSLRSYEPKLQCIVSYTAPENHLIPLPDNDQCSLPLDLLLAPSSSLIAPLFIDTTFQRKHLLRNPLDGRRLKSSLNYVSIVPARQKAAGMCGTKITLAYECGATFDITFNGNETDDASCERIWASIFRSPDFLRQLQYRAFLHSQKCSSCSSLSCRNDEMINIGVMPTGAMQVFEVPEAICPGFEPGLFLISYKIESGVQKDYHENPGVMHPGTSREAYVPNNVQGRALIQRLIYAFAHGMTFRVGVSESTGKPNSVTWAAIPHKTSLTYGSFGYPDHSYFDEVNEQLNILGVPSTFPVFSIDR